MCFSLAAFNPAGLPVRIQDPKCVGKTFPDYFEALFSVSRQPPRHPGDLRRRPHRVGQGHAGRGRGRSALGYHLLDSGALYRVTAWPPLRAGLAIDAGPEAAPRQLAGPCRCASTAAHAGWTATT